MQVGPDGRLVGDRLQQYLVIGNGPDQPLQGLLAEDPAGRWLVVRRSDRVWLLDTRGGSSTDLTGAGFDDRADRLAYAPHRALSFDGSGTRLAYLRRQQGKTRVIVRSLDSGAETEVDPGPGAVWRVDLDWSGEWVILRVLVEDTNGNGRLNWPVPKASADPPRCTGPMPHFDAWVDRGDTPIVRVVSSRGGKARTEAGFVAPFGRSLLLREPGGRLLLRLPNRTTKQMADAKCGARIIHADPLRGLVLAACGSAEGRPPLTLLSLAKNVSLDQEVAPQSHDRWPGETPRLVAVYPGAGALLVDMDRRSTVPLSPGDGVVSTSGARALVRRGRSLHLFDAGTGRWQSLAGTTALHPYLVRSGPVAVVSPLVVDVGKGRLLGQVEQRPLAVTTTGSVLVAIGGDGSADRLAVGPLQWVSPSPSRGKVFETPPTRSRPRSR